MHPIIAGPVDEMEVKGSDPLLCWEEPLTLLKGPIKSLENKVNATKQHNMLVSEFSVLDHDIYCQFCLFMAWLDLVVYKTIISTFLLGSVFLGNEG